MTKGLVNIILVIIIAVLAEMLIIKSNRKPEKDLRKEIELQRKYDSCQLAIVSLKDTISSYRVAIESLGSFDKALMEQYKNKKNEITDLQKQLSVKNGVVELLNSYQLERELASRYDSTKR